MSRKGALIGVAVLLVLASALAYVGWKVRASTTSRVCYACSRPIHGRTRTLGLLNGKSEVFCCPMCALTEHLQTGERVRLTELTDFDTRARLAPENAVLVSGSDVNDCVRDHMLISQEKQANPMDFDRCSPSIIAFAQRREAVSFQKLHGGTILSFEELSTAYQR